MQVVNAFGEELLFRGVIFAILLSQSKWKAIALALAAYVIVKTRQEIR